MHLVRYLGPNLLIILLYVSFISVKAQTTSITQLTYPTRAVAGSLEPLPVTVSIPYNETKAGYWLLVGIIDQLNKTVPGSVEGSPSPCINPSAQAICQAQLQSTSGIEYLQFKIGGIFASTQPPPGVWNLQILAEVLGSNSTILSRSEESFAIYLTPVALIIDVPSNITVTVDATPTTGGNIPVAIGHHSISVPMFVTVNDSERLTFDSWSDGASQPNRTLLVPFDMEIKAIYHVQYRLSINSNVPGVNVAGAGWYENGSLAAFSVPVTQLSPSTGAVLELLGARTVFQGWFEGGSLITSSSSGTIDMNRPHSITAQWVTDYNIPIIIFVLAIAVGVGAYFAKRQIRKIKRPKTGKVEVKRSRGRYRSKRR